MNNNMEQAPNNGLNVGLKNIDVFKNTDVSVLGKRKGYDKSSYTRTTHPDGTVTETVKMNQKNSRGGLVDVSTEGINFGDNAVDVGLSKEVSEDAVSFVDSIWGSKTAAGKTQDVRMEKAKLEAFKAEREAQLHQDSEKRHMMNVNQNVQSSGRSL